MEGWEYQEWKEMCRSVKKVGGMDVKDREAFQRRFCNDFLLWFLAVDIRYGYEVTDGEFLPCFLLVLVFGGGLLESVLIYSGLRVRVCEDGACAAGYAYLR